MKFYKNIFFFILLFSALNLSGQSVFDGTLEETITTEVFVPSESNTEDDIINGNWVEVEIIDGCLDIETSDDEYGNYQNFRVSLTEEQLDLSNDFRLSISDGANVLLSGFLSEDMPSTPPIIFNDIALGIYLITLHDEDHSYECMMKITFKEAE